MNHLLKSEKEWKRFGLSFIPSNRCYVPLAIQIELKPVVLVGTNPARSTAFVTLLAVLTHLTDKGEEAKERRKIEVWPFRDSECVLFF